MLLVQPAAAAVLEAARDLVGQQRHPDPDTGQAEVADAEMALAAAVDALPGDEWQRRTVGGPDHDGLTGAPIQPLEGVSDETGRAQHRVCGNRACWCWQPPSPERREAPTHLAPAGQSEPAMEPDATCDYEWWANDDGHICREPAGHAEDHVCPCGAHRMPPDAPEPALEPAGDGPGWDRSNVERIIAMVAAYPIGASGDGDQLRNLLADRDRLAAAVEATRDQLHLAATNKWQADAIGELRGERDAARAELDQQARVAANLFSLAERRFVALERARAELAEHRGCMQRVERELAEATAERDEAREGAAVWKTHAREWEATAGRHQADMNAGRAELADQVAKFLDAVNRITAEREGARRELSDALGDLGAAKADRDRLREQLDAIGEAAKVDGEGWQRLRRQRDDAYAELDRLFGLAERAMSERSELQQLFELQLRRTADATALWRAEAPQERALIQPDLGALLKWLMDRADVASRDAAADALDWAREQLDPSQVGASRLPPAVLGRIAAEIRSGQRPVPGSPEPASSEEAS